MTSDESLPPADEAPEPSPAEEDVVEAPVRDETTATGSRRTLVDRLPATWRDPVSVPRWEVAVAIGLISALLAVAIATSGLALTQTTSAPATGAAPGAVTVSDNFGRGSEDSLGVAPSGQAWKELQGDWGVGFNSVRILRPDGNLPSLTVVDLGDTDGLVRIRIGTVTAGMGVAVRVRNSGTYLAIEAEPAFGTYAIRRVVNGQETELGDVGLANAADNAVVEVRMRGDSIDVYVDGAYVKSVTDRPAPDATGVGLIGEPGTADARWALFEARNATSLTQGLPARPATTVEG